MGVTYESQVCAECDLCGKIELTSVMKVIDFKMWLRSRGWTIGKTCLCAECAKKKNNEVSPRV